VQVLKGSNPGQVKIICFMQPLCCCFTMKNIYSAENAYFSKIHYHTSLYDPVLTSGTNISAISQVGLSVHHVGIINCKNKKYEYRVTSNRIMCIPDSTKIKP
jgi:hypothetical protein